MSVADRLLGRLHAADMAEKTEAKLRAELAQAKRDGQGIPELRAQLTAQGKAIEALAKVVTELSAKCDAALAAQAGGPSSDAPSWKAQVVSRDGNGRLLELAIVPGKAH